MDDLVDKLHATWLAAGRSNDDFLQCIGTPHELHPHEEYLAARAGITLPADFLKTTKALLGEPTFDELLSTLKALAIEPSVPKALNPNGLFAFRVCQALRASVDLPRIQPISDSARRAL
jgi:hypothetical protein